MRVDKQLWIHREDYTVSRVLDYALSVSLAADGSWSVIALGDGGAPVEWNVGNITRTAHGRGGTIGAALDDMHTTCPWSKPDPPACQPHRLKPVRESQEEQ